MAEHAYDRLIWDESTDIATTLGELGDAEFDTMSLCEGWRVRDVVSHMIVGHTTPLSTILLEVAKNRFSVPKASFEASREYGSAHSAAEIRDAWSAVARDHTRKGISKTISEKEGFVDHLIHHQDIRRPVGRPRTIPAERLTAALDALPTIGGFLKSKQRMKDLSWRATDVDWSFGEGPEVSGPAEALILASSGRPAALPELSGDGHAALASRLAA
ncbi:MAG TPA: maleylpyruvate isomerase family mycothiol-dependent enzyme [Acidimicrobiia bacterium]|nr:maleylpyruvate isomerase family mycothiol-dependent enzyme [Acidimicrobiia bacterium]